MKVLMVISQLFYSARGTPLSAYHRIKDLRAMGHEVEVLTYGLGDPPPDLPIVVHRARGPHFARTIKQGPSMLKIWFDVLLFVDLIRLMATKKYDAVYAHEEGAFLSALVCPFFRVPYVYDMHSSLPLQIRDWNFSDKEWVVKLFRMVERFAVSRACAVVAISPRVAGAALDACPRANVVTILNRFLVEKRATPAEGRALRLSLGIKPDRKVVLYTGTFVPLQALDLLVDAIPAVLKKCPDAHFVLVGGAPSQVGPLEAQAKRLGVSDALTLVTHRPQSEMPEFLAAADALVSPRVKGINPPGKLFSYLDSGKPVVATDRPIHSQILEPDFSILTEPTPDALAEGLVSALTDTARVQALSARAREALETKYGNQAREDAYARLLRFIHIAVDRRSGARTLGGSEPVGPAMPKKPAPETPL